MRRIARNVILIHLLGLAVGSGFFMVPRVLAHVPPGGSFCMFLRRALLTQEGCKAVTSGIDSSISKIPANAELVGAQTTTTLTIGFRVTSSGGAGITNVVWRERLANNFTFANPADIRLNGNQLPGNPNPAGSNSADIPLGNLSPGNYSLSFRVTINANTPEGTYPIEQADTACADPNARFEYTDGLGRPACTGLPAGSIIRRFPKLTLNADAWIGNKPVTQGNYLRIGNTALIISGGSTNQSGGLGVSGYNLPTTGKFVWQQFEDLMKQRITRNIETQTAKFVRSCGGGAISALYLDSKTNPFDGSNRDPNANNVWVFDRCQFTFDNLTIYGSGTIVNIDVDSRGRSVVSYNGGNLTIRGKVSVSNPNNVFGYITFGNGSGAGRITINGDAETRNMALFTNGLITIDANPNASPVTHQVHLISRNMQFPNRAAMRGDSIFESSSPVRQTPPALFEQFHLPSGREVP